MKLFILVGTMLNKNFTKDDLKKSWNLYKDDLNDQDEPTIDFIYSLVK